MGFFRNGTQELHYIDVGQGPVVVLLHGLASCGEDWEQQIESLSSSHRVIAPDFRGHGKSSLASRPFQMKDLATDVLTLLQTLNIDAYHLVGFSLGGMAAFELALLDHARITSLTIINSGPGINASGYTIRIKLLIRKSIILLFGMHRLGKLIGKKLLPDEKHAELRARFEEKMRRMNRRNYQYTLNAIGQFNVQHRIHTLTMPTLIISSDQDYTPVSTKEAYAKLMQNSEVKVIKDSRHATPLDQPKALNKLILDFFSDVPRKNSYNA